MSFMHTEGHFDWYVVESISKGYMDDVIVQ